MPFPPLNGFINYRVKWSICVSQLSPHLKRQKRHVRLRAYSRAGLINKFFFQVGGLFNDGGGGVARGKGLNRGWAKIEDLWYT